MLKKLYKHEFYALFRSLLPIYAALLGFAVLSRITFLFDIKNKIVDAVLGLSAVLYVFAIIAVFVVGLVIVVMRFYKHLLSHEGYLTFTLPVTPTQHITCKLVCGVTVTIIGFILVICSLLILGAGTEILSEIFNGLKAAYNAVIAYVSKAQIIIIAIEIIALSLISVFQQLLMYYASISIGQQFKNRIAGAVISYICLYAAVQIIVSVIMSVVSIIIAGSAEEFNLMINNSVWYVVILMLCVIVFYLILGTVYFFISRHFLTKKLNLE